MFCAVLSDIEIDPAVKEVSIKSCEGYSLTELVEKAYDAGHRDALAQAIKASEREGA